VALRLFGVTVNDAHTAQAKVGDIEAVAVRDLVAICRETDHRASAPSEEAVRTHASVIAAYAAAGPILPAPVGVVFRTADSVRRWLELHFSTLTEAMSFVENRVGGRVHVFPRAEPASDDGDLVTRATESLRALRRSAVATVPLPQTAMPEALQSAAFLVELELWKDFAAEVEAQGKVASTLRFEVTGPFPPYDFVRMQLGA
jgi:hypothetical protein